ncbi:sensor histidine kinase [Stenotrophomonas nitritireducens]|uniref:sensor histidine kinase n=1 Tax=Stenotrophomonas nitritireducens TaxID=83617 RepID=UPI003D984FF1
MLSRSSRPADPAEPPPGAPGFTRRWMPPAVDATEARAAAMLLRLWLLVAGYQLLLLLWGAPSTGLLAQALTVAGMLACLVCLELLRRRRLHLSVVVFVVLNLVLTSVAYGYWGLRAQMHGQLLQLLPVLLAGALLGRRALWLATGWLGALLALGAWLDAAAGFYLPVRVEMALRDLSLAAFGMTLAAFVLDQSLSSLRDNLRIAQRRGADLARKRDELQLEMHEKERSREQLVHALKIENVGRLASGVAHDFNHLLALIMGYAGKCRRSDDPVELKAALQGVESAARRAGAVTRRLLDFSRQDVARPQLLDAAPTIAAMEPMLRQLFDARVAFELDTGHAQCQIHFDPAQLELVLLSLAANAQQAMPDGGAFRLALSCPEPGNELRIEVSDSGHGMSEDVRRRCLEPFFTTKPSGQGTGLGLAVAANLVAAADGRIEVESAPGEGTRFHLHLPARPLSAEPAHRPGGGEAIPY